MSFVSKRWSAMLAFCKLCLAYKPVPMPVFQPPRCRRCRQQRPFHAASITARSLQERAVLRAKKRNTYTKALGLG